MRGGMKKQKKKCVHVETAVMGTQKPRSSKISLGLTFHNHLGVYSLSVFVYLYVYDIPF